jgi:hypothetical protein
MKERNSIMTQNPNNQNSSTGSHSTYTTSLTANTNNIQDNSQNFLSPYNSNNFMAPPIGGTIRCVTCLGNTVQGKVIAYDQQTKMLALSMIIFK